MDDYLDFIPDGMADVAEEALEKVGKTITAQPDEGMLELSTAEMMALCSMAALSLALYREHVKTKRRAAAEMN